jgi:hypothetical protein
MIFMEQDKNKQTPEPRLNEQDLREQVKSSPAYEGNRSQGDIDGERNRQDEEEGSRHIRDKGHNAAAAEGRINTNFIPNINDEAKNVNDDTGRPLTDEEAHQARNKSGQGYQQGRDTGSPGIDAKE